MEAYKAGQGSLARLSATLGLIITLLLGCVELYAWIQSPKDTSLIPLAAFEKLPLLNVPFSLKFVFCAALFGVGTWGIRRWLSRPTTVNALIETESEMKKVSWPTYEESRNATVIVILVAVILTAALFFFDQVFAKLLQLFI